MSKLGGIPNDLASRSASGDNDGADRASNLSSHAHVRLLDCASSIYDCSVALLALATDEYRALSSSVGQSAGRSILSAWRSDFETSQLREGFGRYGNEFGIMMEFLAHSDNGPCSICISGADIVAIGYVCAAAARHCLAYLVGGSSSRYHSQFCAALSTFFGALFLCDNTPSSIDALRDAASR